MGIVCCKRYVRMTFWANPIPPPYCDQDATGFCSSIRVYPLTRQGNRAQFNNEKSHRKSH